MTNENINIQYQIGLARGQEKIRLATFICASNGMGQVRIQTEPLDLAHPD